MRTLTPQPWVDLCACVQPQAPTRQNGQGTGSTVGRPQAPSRSPQGSAEVDKKALSERDICTKFITPALAAAGWNTHSQMREEVNLTAGRVVVRGNRAARDKSTIRRADYVLYFKPGMPLAVVEAKDNKHTLRDGIQQALDYAAMLDVPFAFSSLLSGVAGFIMLLRDVQIGNDTSECWNQHVFKKPSPAMIKVEGRHIRCVRCDAATLASSDPDNIAQQDEQVARFKV